MGQRNRIEAINCPACRQPVAAPVVGAVHHSESDFLVSLTECQLCGLPILLGQEVFAPDQASPPKRLWPEPDPEIPYSVSPMLRAAFNEAAMCYSSGAYTASVVMVRRFLDGIATELGGPSDKSLERKIEWMHQNDFIDDRLLAWADALRLVGNRAVHEVTETVTREDAGDVLTLAEAIANYLFVIKDKFEAFQRRQADR